MKLKELNSVSKPVSSSSVATRETHQTLTNAIITPYTTNTKTTLEVTSNNTKTTLTTTTTIKTTASTATTKITTLPIESSKTMSSKPFKPSKSTKSNSYVTEIGAIESSKVSPNITNSTPSHKNFTSNQLSIITLSALLGCIYGVAFIIASTWVGLLWLKRRRKSSEFKSSRIDTDFNTIDSSNCIHRA